jgi:hypothetical protein
VIRKERCPQCAKLGNDRSGDNLAIYNDGHTYCFRCGYGSRRTRIVKPVDEVKQPEQLFLPQDVTTELPYEARKWLNQYDLTRMDISGNNVMWSEQLQRIIFPYFNETGLLAWQGRYVEKEIQADKKRIDSSPAKWYSQGKIHEIIHPIKVRDSTAVLVEDIISAIKVSRVQGSIPIFGSNISAKHWLRLKHIVDRVWVWLDPDMRSKSVKMAFMGQLLGIRTTCIFSDKDPKEHSFDEIAKYLGKD